MCGIVAAIAKRPIAEILLMGLHALEYRGYDSAGLFVCDGQGHDYLVKSAGKVEILDQQVKSRGADGTLGIAHTRWATHGEANSTNAHPHQVGDVTIVHNGIIENYQELKQQLLFQGYTFKTKTDTEVLAALIDSCRKLCPDFLTALRQALKQVTGSYSIALIVAGDSEHFYIARNGAPLVIGLGIGENFTASDILALVPVTSRFIYLEEGDVAMVGRKEVKILDAKGDQVSREVHSVDVSRENFGKGQYKHYMQKEIFEQPDAIRNTMLGRLAQDDVNEQAFVANTDLAQRMANNASATTGAGATATAGAGAGAGAGSSAGGGSAAMPTSFKQCLKDIEHIEIVACGTSYHAGLVGKYVLEENAGISTNVSIASEYRYRRTIVPPHSLLVTISQSGETADTLAALKLSRSQGYAATLCICNVANSSLVRESDFAFLTRAGTEIGVASTKAFITQLVALNMLTLALGRANGEISAQKGAELVKVLHFAPELLNEVLLLDKQIEDLSWDFVGKDHCLYLGRGPMYPLALEGALKLKEISYIHAEGYAAGELKHGPIALIDEQMPVIVVAPDNELLPKLVSNIEEVRARGGKLYVFTDTSLHVGKEETDAADVKAAERSNVNEQCRLVRICSHAVSPIISPIVFTIPLQLLAYHVAVINGTDVDQPRNLAKSVTVE